MSDDPQTGPDLDEAPGWVVTDPDGNIVDSGPITHAMAAFLVDQASEEEQD